MSPWDWFTATAPAGAIIQTLGLGVLAVLFATDRVITKGGHERRVADINAAHEKIVAAAETTHAAAIAELVKHHEELVKVKDGAYAELKESRDYYRAARIEERDRADKVTDQLAEVAELARLTTHLLASFNEAADGARS